jgi:hypothetical protein
VAPAGRSEKAGALSGQFMWEPVGASRDLYGREQCDRIHTVLSGGAGRVFAAEARLPPPSCDGKPGPGRRPPNISSGSAYSRWHRGGIGVLALSQHPRHRSRSLIGPISYPWARVDGVEMAPLSISGLHPAQDRYFRCFHATPFNRLRPLRRFRFYGQGTDCMVQFASRAVTPLVGADHRAKQPGSDSTQEGIRSSLEGNFDRLKSRIVGPRCKNQSRTG